MSENNKLVELEPVDMHGPVMVTAGVYLYLPDGRAATISFRMEPGTIPTAAKIKATLDALASPEALAESSVPEGTRLMTKPEFVAHFTKQETGQAMTLPGDQHFVPAPSEIPHGMLVHAIQGVDIETDLELSVAAELVNDYADRGLMTIDRTPNEQNKVAVVWNSAKLAELPDAVLLAIYQRIAQ